MTKKVVSYDDNDESDDDEDVECDDELENEVDEVVSYYDADEGM